MPVYQWLCLFGVPTIFTSVVLAVFGQIKKTMKKQKTEQQAESEALRKGVQALLRSQMVNEWEHYSLIGWAPIYARENFENMWQQYHGLGANGVMDMIHQRFMDLPFEPSKSNKEDETNDSEMV